MKHNDNTAYQHYLVSVHEDNNSMSIRDTMSIRDNVSLSIGDIVSLSLSNPHYVPGTSRPLKLYLLKFVCDDVLNVLLVNNSDFVVL